MSSNDVKPTRTIITAAAAVVFSAGETTTGCSTWHSARMSQFIYRVGRSAAELAVITNYVPVSRIQLG